jgi:hypothetical protein
MRRLAFAGQPPFLPSPSSFSTSLPFSRPCSRSGLADEIPNLGRDAFAFGRAQLGRVLGDLLGGVSHLLAQLSGAELRGRVEVEASRNSDKLPLRPLEALDGIALLLRRRRRLGLWLPPHLPHAPLRVRALGARGIKPAAFGVIERGVLLSRAPLLEGVEVLKSLVAEIEADRPALFPGRDEAHRIGSLPMRPPKEIIERFEAVR